MTKLIRFENELILHLLTQKHLKELFGLECVASEKQLHGQRMDTLAFDPKNHCLVIIEYKNRFNAKVLKQAQDYNDLVLNNKKEFCNLLKEKGYDYFDNTKVMIIGPKFNDDQIAEAEPFELWKVSLYDNCNVEYEQLNTDETKKNLKKC